MPVEIKKGRRGYVITYNCRCGTKLKSKGEDAGKQDYCPDCRCEFIVPGERAMAEIAAREASAREAAALALEIKTSRSKATESLEFLELLDEVSEDGELTHSEIRSIARWINEHRDGRQYWPATRFLPLLKGVFADGIIDQSEARQVASLIQSVRRDWVRYAGSVVRPEYTESSLEPDTSDEAVTFSPNVARLPAISFALAVPSDSSADTEYNLDFGNPSCTCPDFRSYRQQLPSGHISRCCKHLMRGYAQIRPEAGWPGWLDPFLEAGFKPLPSQEWDTVQIGEEWFLISSASNTGWANAYATLEGEPVKFGYSTIEDRWAYGKEPPSPHILERAINKLSQ